MNKIDDDMAKSHITVIKHVSFTFKSLVWSHRDQIWNTGLMKIITSNCAEHPSKHAIMCCNTRNTPSNKYRLDVVGR